jgi:hypothetical protein
VHELSELLRAPKLFDPRLTASGFEVSTIAQLKVDVRSMFNDSQATALGSGFDRVAQQENGRTILALANVWQRPDTGSSRRGRSLLK